MSDWRLDLRTLYEAGGRASTLDWGTYFGCRDLVALGLATRERDPQDRRHRVYVITPLGRDVAEGRVRRALQGPRKSRWVSTWLSSLPVGLRLTRPVCTCGREPA